MKTRNFLFAAAVLPMLVVSCKDGNSSNSAQEIPDRSNVIINVPRGEQAPPANPGQRNFGGMMPARWMPSDLSFATDSA